MGVGVRDLVRGEPLERDVEPSALRDGDAAESGCARRDQVVRRRTEHAEVPQDLVEISDGPVRHGRILPSARDDLSSRYQGPPDVNIRAWSSRSLRTIRMPISSENGRSTTTGATMKSPVHGHSTTM